MDYLRESDCGAENLQRLKAEANCNRGNRTRGEACRRVNENLATSDIEVRAESSRSSESETAISD